jgi:hypothetical protein
VSNGTIAELIEVLSNYDWFRVEFDRFLKSFNRIGVGCMYGSSGPIIDDSKGSASKSNDYVPKVCDLAPIFGGRIPSDKIQFYNQITEIGCRGKFHCIAVINIGTFTMESCFWYRDDISGMVYGEDFHTYHDKLKPNQQWDSCYIMWGIWLEHMKLRLASKENNELTVGVDYAISWPYQYNPAEVSMWTESDGPSPDHNSSVVSKLPPAPIDTRKTKPLNSKRVIIVDDQ